MKEVFFVALDLYLIKILQKLRCNVSLFNYLINIYMKKLIALLSIVFIMSSCSLFKQDDDSTIKVDPTPAPVEVDTDAGETRDGTTPSNEMTDKDGEGKADTSDDTEDTGSEPEEVDTSISDEEVVEEFEKELDALFELLENEE